ncbi:MAG: hypothetical protein GWO08_09870 [Gammaproteobacteria bacterium]|nr:hypothetical protein [Gammaproteobacteria bacterium]NIO61670.1 hypothetical protein [Gammaproteobacteria bacterium]NIQ10065.1 hypothetical protein [Gammaproteobacteria bacterium]NIQ18921.1 hypothetical protein [Gammaproteobacteria bacterium]NIQ74800.1 hypothetical protein [Gammaproteobacteria bacterium]
MADNNAIPVEAVDPDKKTSSLLGKITEESTVQLDLKDQKCYWNDIEFEPGDRVLNDGTCYECCYGRWIIVEEE